MSHHCRGPRAGRGRTHASGLETRESQIRPQPWQGAFFACLPQCSLASMDGGSCTHALRLESRIPDDCRPSLEQQGPPGTRASLRLRLPRSPVTDMRLPPCLGHVVSSLVKTATPATRDESNSNLGAPRPRETGLCMLPGRDGQTRCRLSTAVDDTDSVSTAAATTSVISHQLLSPW